MKLAIMTLIGFVQIVLKYVVFLLIYAPQEFGTLFRRYLHQEDNYHLCCQVVSQMSYHHWILYLFIILKVRLHL